MRHVNAKPGLFLGEIQLGGASYKTDLASFPAGLWGRSANPSTFPYHAFYSPYLDTRL